MTTMTEVTPNAPTASAEGAVGTPAAPAAVANVANPAATDPNAAKAPEGAQAVEYTDFTLPEGMTLDTEVSAEFKEFAKGKGLSQEDAQKLVDMQTKLANKQMDAWGEKLAAWKSDATADKEFGGAAFEANVSVAKTALDKFGTAELKEILNTTGMGNHPEVIRFFYRVGKTMAPDAIMGPGGSTPAAKSPEELMFPSMFKTA